MRLLLILPTHTYQADAYMAAAQKLGVDLTVASEVDSTFSRPEYEGLLTLDFCDPAAAAAAVEKFATQHPVNAVFGVDDRTSVVAAHVADRLSLPYSPITSVEAASNKLLQRQTLAAAGIRVPTFALATLRDTPSHPHALAPPYPVVVKPLGLSASRGVIRANNTDEFASAASTIKDILREEPDGIGEDGFLIEQYVPGREYAVEGIVLEGDFRSYAIFEKPDPLDGPFFEETIYLTPPRIEEDRRRRIVEGVQGAVAALGLTQGPVHAEVRVNGEDVWVIEVAARPIGGKCGRVLRFGENGSISLEELNLAVATGLRSSVPALAPEASGVLMIPIPHAGVLERISGVDVALAVTKVTDVVITISLGTRLRRLPYESRYLGFIFARAETSGAVDRALRSAHSELHFTVSD